MAYVPDPTNVNLPDDSISAETAQAEFRALKAYLAGLAGLGSGMNLFRRNKFFNPKMDIAQRGTSFAQTAAGTTAYTLDRWFQLNSAVGRTISQQAAGPTNGFKNCLRISRDAANADVSTIQFGQTLETLDCLDAAGSTVILSWYMRAGANFSAAGGTVTSNVQSGEGTDQSAASQLAGTWANQVTAGQANVATAAWQRFSQVVPIAAAKTQLGIRLFWVPVGVAGAADYIEVTGFQLEVAAVASPFEFRSVDTELTLCRRYYQKTFRQAVAPANGNGDYNGSFGVATSVNPSEPTANWNFGTVMRVAPTIVFYNPRVGGAVGQWNDAAGADGATATSSNPSETNVQLRNGGTALTGGATKMWYIQVTADSEL